MKKLMLKLSKVKFELRKFIIGLLYLTLLTYPFMNLNGSFDIELFVVLLGLTIILTIQQLILYGNNTKWNESIKF